MPLKRISMYMYRADRREASKSQQNNKLNRLIEMMIPVAKKAIQDDMHPKPFKPVKFPGNYKPGVILGPPAPVDSKSRPIIVGPSSQKG